jgi:hypothetical protein
VFEGSLFSPLKMGWGHPQGAGGKNRRSPQCIQGAGVGSGQCGCQKRHLLLSTLPASEVWDRLSNTSSSQTSRLH